MLMIHNIKHGLRIEPPGGKKHEDETSEEAVVRELKEEVGVEVRPVKILCVHDTHTPEGDFRVETFLCEILQGEPRCLEPEKCDRIAWYTPEELERLWDEGHLVQNAVDALQTIREYL